MEIFILFIAIILGVILLTALFSKPPENKSGSHRNFNVNHNNESHNDFQKRLYNIPNDFSPPPEETPHEFLLFLKNVDQNKIEYLKYNNFIIKDQILRNAFVYRWRNEKLDYDYYKEMLDERIYKKTHGIKRTKRSDKELYEELFIKLKKFEDSGYEKVEDFIAIDIDEIKGVHVQGRYNYLNKLDREIEMILEKENNEYDKNAVRILHKNKVVGYVPSGKTKYIRRVINFGYHCRLFDCYEEDGYKYASYIIYLKKITF